MPDSDGLPPLHNKFYNRRKALTAFSTLGMTLLSGVGLAAPKERKAPGPALTRTYGSVPEMQQDASLKAGMLVQTAGFYAIGDGGGGTYLVGPATTVQDGPDSLIPLKKGLAAALTHVTSVNYKLFGARGDGSQDDGVAIKAAHRYANHFRVPVVNLSGEYWLRETNQIPIQTNVQWGHTIFHLDEQFNSKSHHRFEVLSRRQGLPVNLDAGQKRRFLDQLKPGVQVIPELAPFKNCLVIIADKNDRIGFRAGAKYTGQSWAREDLFYVEEHGRILGDIAWQFRDYSSLMAYPADEN